MKAALHTKDLTVIFVITADIDFDYFNSIFIARVIHSLCPEGVKGDSFSFFTF